MPYDNMGVGRASTMRHSFRANRLGKCICTNQQKMYDLKANFEFIKPRMNSVRPNVGPAYGGQEVHLDGLYAIPSPDVLKGDLDG